MLSTCLAFRISKRRPPRYSLFIPLPLFIAFTDIRMYFDPITIRFVNHMMEYTYADKPGPQTNLQTKIQIVNLHTDTHMYKLRQSSKHRIQDLLLTNQVTRVYMFMRICLSICICSCEYVVCMYILMPLCVSICTCSHEYVPLCGERVWEILTDYTLIACICALTYRCTRNFRITP